AGRRVRAGLAIPLYVAGDRQLRDRRGERDHRSVSRRIRSEDVSRPFRRQSLGLFLLRLRLRCPARVFRGPALARRLADRPDRLRLADPVAALVAPVVAGIAALADPARPIGAGGGGGAADRIPAQSEREGEPSASGERGGDPRRWGAT